MKGADLAGADYVCTPLHAGKAAEAVVLVLAGEGPCWYCSRFVRDEYVRQRRGQSTRFTGENQPPKDGADDAPKSASNGNVVLAAVDDVERHILLLHHRGAGAP